eukprot:45475-Rhodomonas_salina.3
MSQHAILMSQHAILMSQHAIMSQRLRHNILMPKSDPSTEVSIYEPGHRHKADISMSQRWHHARSQRSRHDAHAKD